MQIVGVDPVPTGATGVILNLNGTQVTDATYVSAWPAGEVQQDTSVLDLMPGTDSPKMITAALGVGGALNLYSFTGSVHLVADVAGYLVPGGGDTPGPQGPAGDPDVTNVTLPNLPVRWVIRPG